MRKINIFSIVLIIFFSLLEIRIIINASLNFEGAIAFFVLIFLWLVICSINITNCAMILTYNKKRIKTLRVIYIISCITALFFIASLISICITFPSLYQYGLDTKGIIDLILNILFGIGIILYIIYLISVYKKGYLTLPVQTE